MNKFIKMVKNIPKSLYGNFLEILSNTRPLDNKLVVFIPSTREPFSGNCKALFEYLLNNTDLKVIYFVNSKKEQEELNKKYRVSFFYLSSDLSAIKKASEAKAWFLYDLPVHFFLLYFLKNKERIVYYLGHGVPLKKIALSSNNISFLRWLHRYLRVSCYTHVLSYSEFIIPTMREAFGVKANYVPVGPPVNDIEGYKNSSLNLTINKNSTDKFVLYAPTWRENEDCKFFPFSDFDFERLNSTLVKKNTTLFLRPHGKKPYYLDEQALVFSNIKMLDSFKFPDVNKYFSLFDALITDYSSIYFDFLLYDKPLAFLPYDYEDYEKNPGFGLPYKDATPGHIINIENEFMCFIEELETDKYRNKRHDFTRKLNIKGFNNCFENYEIIKKLLASS